MSERARGFESHPLRFRTEAERLPFCFYVRGFAFICISRRILFKVEGDIRSLVPKKQPVIDMILSEKYPAREIVTDQADILKLEM